MTTSTKGKHHCHNPLLHPLLRLSVHIKDLTSCCHLTSGQLAKVYISCTAHQKRTELPRATSRNLRIRPFHFLQVHHVKSSIQTSVTSWSCWRRTSPPSPPTSVHPSPASPPQPLGPLDVLTEAHDIVRSFSEFHIKRDATYIAPAINGHQGHLQQV